MADETPSSAYSDPFYDRLERTFHWLGRRWLIVVAAIIVAVIIAVTLRQSAAASPEAASAAALHQARQGGMDALVSFAGDEDFTPESRARAALLVSDDALQNEDIQRAVRYAERARELAEASGIANLRAAATISYGAALEAAGDGQAAVDAYRWVVDTFRGQLISYARSADIASALLLADLAEGDSDQATDQRMEALRILADYADSDPRDGGEAVIAAATWRYYALRRQFPDLASELDRERGLGGDDHTITPSEEPDLESEDADSPLPDVGAQPPAAGPE